MSDYYFGQFTPEHLPRIKEGVESFNKKHYWDCHEVLEDVWLEDQGDDARLIYWTIIQVATALYHYEDSNLEGMTGMIQKAKDKIRRAEEKNVVTDIVKKHLSWDQFVRLVMKIPDKGASKSDFDQLYEFKFEDYVC